MLLPMGMLLPLGIKCLQIGQSASYRLILLIINPGPILGIMISFLFLLLFIYSSS
jgi:hypothetical protein